MRLSTWFSALVLLAPLACGGSSTQTTDPAIGAGTTGGGTDDEPTKTVDTPAEKTPAEAFAAECIKGLDRAKAALPGLLAVKGDRDEANLLVPYNKLLVDVYESAGTASLMGQVHPEKAIRDAANKCTEAVSEFGSALSRNKQLFEAISKIDVSKLDPLAKRFVERELRDFRRGGVDKDEATQKRLAEIDAKLTKLGTDFSKNLSDDVKSMKVKPEELAGMPADWIENHKVGADGMVTVTTDYPDYRAFRAYADSQKRRAELSFLYHTRGGEKNEKILREVLTLRAEKAKLLGYANWAAFNLEDKMVKTPKAAQKFISRALKSSARKGKKDYAELLKYKRKHIDKKAKRVQYSERHYIEDKVRKAKYAFDSQSVRPYFPYKQVRKGLLDITAKMYGIKYTPATDAKLWHQDVEAFDVVRTADGKKLGRIYLDMHPREGKYKHAAQFSYRYGVDGLQLPEGALVCNFPNPRTDGDALMLHNQVETMFHEFGHLMHHVFKGHNKWVALSSTERDFVEAPSQMFEEWANDHSTLALFAKHHETGEVIPKKTVAAMRKASTFGIGNFARQQMFYASVSLGFHTADPAKLDMRKEVKRLQNKFTQFPYVEGTLFHASFGHLLGYSAHYYTYMWSEVISKDLLTPFKKKGLMDPGLAAKYRDTILAPGGTKDAAQLVRDFLGRDFNYKAFENYLAGR